jgi:hypothetical protein
MNLCDINNDNINNSLEEGDFCISCNNYKCYDSLNFNYNSCIYGQYGKTKLFYIETNLVHKFPDNYKGVIKSYKELDNIFSICYDCIERINHPTLFEKIKFWLYGF